MGNKKNQRRRLAKTVHRGRPRKIRKLEDEESINSDESYKQRCAVTAKPTYSGPKTRSAMRLKAKHGADDVPSPQLEPPSENSYEVPRQLARMLVQEFHHEENTLASPKNTPVEVSTMSQAPILAEIPVVNEIPASNGSIDMEPPVRTNTNQIHLGSASASSNFVSKDLALEPPVQTLSGEIPFNPMSPASTEELHSEPLEVNAYSAQQIPEVILIQTSDSSTVKFGSKDQVPPPANYQELNDPDLQPPNLDLPSEFNHIERPSRPALSWNTARIHSFLNEDDSSSSDAVGSGHDQGNLHVEVRSYKVESRFGPLLESIFTQYGDIAKNSSLGVLRACLLEAVCRIHQELESKKLENLKKEELKAMLLQVEDLQTLNLEVGWLHSRLKEIFKILSLRKDKKKYEEDCQDLEKLVRTIQDKRDETQACYIAYTKLKKDLADKNKQLNACYDAYVKKKKDVEAKKDNMVLINAQLSAAEARFPNGSLVHGLI